MKFAIISAGTGERLKAEGVSEPKPLVKINGRPMIDRLINIAVSSRADEICCIVNEESTEVRDYLSLMHTGIPVNVVVKSTPSSLHSFYELKPLLKGSYFCMATVDSIFREEDFSEFIRHAEEERSRRDALLAVTGFIDDEKPLYAKLGTDGRILDLPNERGDCDLVTGGIYYFSPRILDELEYVVGNNMMRLRNFLRHLVEKNYSIYGYRVSKIIDVDHLSDIQEAERFLDGRR